jgi:hypothetical protein
LPTNSLLPASLRNFPRHLSICHAVFTLVLVLSVAHTSGFKEAGSWIFSEGFGRLAFLRYARCNSAGINLFSLLDWIRYF